ncbi:DUF2634 domain-containing protein [Clostridium saccharobutylicum]|uniref:DUF2634 domain-containing protein n=1 Tax=Clostridium saccharobutylicum DSM 13864 TaxID=1345695 RepID=U5MVE8_CLOSA|nr:DUF2634 domain-containing protein [Clostridium saccharobutylicum]AGX44503.1 hypothetical protein CLSA_c35420 [Clostridium saccharobutylicum DSM 13864]AQR91797.1 hypothetical protein CLOSC_35250 [Clostridium saccharobutylicum]AQS01699.1 hypothetical protein CSACC_35300 [Clostridium saccharobutylicum]AQS11305.1 hypothetical protein CLOBY_34610 [Clostridium saccharobutylicum]AQS15682.1 hypothetical protein CLOSACC_35300 [Clostridium saccharobutylicum]
MANLFPINSLQAVTAKENKKIDFKGSYAVNLETGEFIKNPDGTVKVLNSFEAYIQWCQLAMMTDRYKYMAYSSRFGRDSISKNIDKKAMELEIKRITQEALLTHPMTSSVDDFDFRWENGEVYYTYVVTTIKKEQKILTSNEKVG